MKVISEDINEREYFYIQIRDIKHLIEDRNLRILERLYRQCINNGKTEVDFIRLDNQYYIDIINNYEEIIDFNYYINESQNYLARVLINSVYDDRESTKHKIEAIRDVIAFQRGELDYKIPIVPTRAFACLNEKQGLFFTTSNLPDLYILSSTTDKSLDQIDYHNFLKEQIKNIKDMEHIKEEELEVDMVPIDNKIIVKIAKKKLKKESIFKKIFNKKNR